LRLLVCSVDIGIADHILRPIPVGVVLMPENRVITPDIPVDGERGCEEDDIARITPGELTRAVGVGMGRRGGRGPFVLPNDDCLGNDSDLVEQAVEQLVDGGG
jgi:hypothetical protein